MDRPDPVSNWYVLVANEGRWYVVRGRDMGRFYDAFASDDPESVAGFATEVDGPHSIKFPNWEEIN